MIDVKYPSSARYSGVTWFSNNVGFFRQDFYVAPATSPEVITITNQASVSPRLSIRNLKALPVAGQDTTFLVTADIGSINASTKGLLVKAEDVSTKKMVPFDTDLIPIIRTS